MNDLVDTTEMYLRTIYELTEEGVLPLRARIAERLDHTGPTVSQTVARMERDGLVHVANDRHLELTEAGRSRALRVMRKHRLAERLLVDVIGLDIALVHDEACRWEHVMSDDVERRLVEILNTPTESPYGTPIPGLEELMAAPPAVVPFQEGVAPLSVVATSEPSEVVIRRLAEPVQHHESLKMLGGVDALPGSRVQAVRTGEGVRLSARDTSTDLSVAEASLVFVSQPS